ncbi:MAG: CBS and ACT domain-containing protein [Tumebacillaceae bacterium]
MLIESMMVRDVITLAPEATLQEALRLIREKRIRHLPIVRDRLLVGLLSDRDLRDAAPSKLEPGDTLALLSNTTCEQLMVRDVITCHPLDFVEDAASQMYRHRVGCLPVVTNGQLVGLITERDILHTLVEMMGVNAPTSRVEIEVPDKVGMLADICDFLRARRINASAVWVQPSTVQGNKRIVFRIRTMDPRRFIQDIQAAGYQVVHPPSTLPDGEV